MTKKELNEILSNCESIATGIVGLTNTLDITKAIGGMLATMIGVNARIAHELSRIADQGGQSFDLAKHDRKIIIDMLADEATPASPTALVEAGDKMAYFLSTWEDLLAGNQMTQEDFNVDCGLPEWKKALAAHEKAVR